MSIRTGNKIVSTLMSTFIVLVLFVGMAIPASAAPIGLSAPENVRWEDATVGPLDYTGRGIWDEVDGAAVYMWELYRNDTGRMNDQNPDNDVSVASGRANTTGVDLAGYITKSGHYYFIVCALDSNEDGEITATWSHSGYLYYNALTMVHPNNPGGGSSGSSDSGSSGGSSGIDYTTGGTSTTSPITQTSSDIKDLATTAKSNGQNVASSKGTGEVTIQGSAWSQLAGLTFQHDTIANGAVQVRVTINNPTAITQDIKVSGYTTGTAVENVEKFFDKYFENKTSVLHLDQTGTWGQEIKIAAKFDLTGMDTGNLVFYSYDKATNTYNQIPNPNYSIDSNGYTHFSTSLAGDIIVSNGPLIKK